jgi:hypothetical protein
MAVAIVLFPVAVQAADQLAYSFESDTNGFLQNSGGTTVTQDTIGATEGTHSLKYSVVAGQTFAGALAQGVNLSPLIGDPPGLNEVTFDLTIQDPFIIPSGQTGFAVIGVTIFGETQADFPGGQLTGLQAQFFDSDTMHPVFNNERHFDGLAAGTYKNFRINLTDATHPLTFDGRQTFNQIFGTLGSGPNDVIPTGFEFYINKSSLPSTIYIDNVRFGTAVPGDYDADGIVDAADYTIWRDTLGSTTDFRANGDTTGASAEVIDQADYTFWKSHFGATSGSGSLSFGSVPEPASWLLLLSGIALWTIKRVKSKPGLAG